MHLLLAQHVSCVAWIFLCACGRSATVGVSFSKTLLDRLEMLLGVVLT